MTVLGLGYAGFGSDALDERREPLAPEPPAAMSPLYEAVPLEVRKRASHGGTCHAEKLHQGFFLGQRASRGIGALGNPVAKHQIDLPMECRSPGAQQMRFGRHGRSIANA